MSPRRPLLLFVLSLLAAGASHAAPERRIEGTVLGAKATYCELPAGCTGTVTVELSRTERVLAIRVPLGTPVSAGCHAVPFGSLHGQRVIVTEVDDASGPTARAISAKDAPPERGC